MRIAYLSFLDSGNVNSWSGVPYNIRSALESCGHDIVRVEPQLPRGVRAISQLRKACYRMGGRRYFSDRDPLVNYFLFKAANEALARLKFDVILSPSSIPIAGLNHSKPAFFWTDATFRAMAGFYPGWSHLAGSTLRWGDLLESRALKRCRAAIYSNDWALRSAITDYSAPSKKLHCVPYGANITPVVSQGALPQFVHRRLGKPYRLLFVGVDWHRKGGPIALEVSKILTARGLPVELHVVGCAPATTVPEYVVVHGFIDKSTASGRDRLASLFTDATFFILPTIAECCAIAYAEACAFGLPVLGSDVGGNTTIIESGSNGFALSSSATASDYADVICRVVGDPGFYAKLSLNALIRFESLLNWKSAIKSLERVLADSVSKFSDPED